MKRIFPSLPGDAHLGDVFARFPDTIAPLLDFHDRLLRGPGDLDIATRELIAAYVSGLNACRFCLGAHQIYARAFGVDPAVIDALLADPDTAPVDPALRPLLAYVRQLTEAPSRITEAQAQAVYDAGWSEEALFTAIQTCALFNLMNRIVEGAGLGGYGLEPGAVSDDDLQTRRSRSYSDWGREIGLD